MTTIYIGEERHGRIKATTDRDCLSPQIIRFEERILPDDDLEGQLMTWAKSHENFGWRVCIDTKTLFYETEANDGTK